MMSSVLLIVVERIYIAPTLRIIHAPACVHARTKLGIHMRTASSTQRTIACTGAYTKAEEAPRACRRWEQYITLTHVCLSISFLSSSSSFLPSHSFPLIQCSPCLSPLLPVPFENLYAFFLALSLYSCISSQRNYDCFFFF